jgi:glycosyltransferase involved in cell wall biosynthesis
MSNNQPQDRANPKVSILVPTFNREKFIEDCIESALDQSCQDFEIIIYDNASTDQTWDICKKLSQTDARIKIFRNEINIGPVKNWMACANKASGEFSKILFSDDILERECLERMLAGFTLPSIGFVYCAAYIGESHEKSRIGYVNKNNVLISSEEFINLVLRGAAPVSPGAILFRTNDLIKNLHTNFLSATPRKYDKNGAGPDVMTSLLTSRDYPLVAGIKLPLVFFRSHYESFTTLNSNNEISNGYRSAIAYFLIKYYGKKVLLRYLAYGWIQSIYYGEVNTNLKKYLRDYEGAGSIYEKAFFILYLIEYVASKLLNKYFNFIKV